MVVGLPRIQRSDRQHIKHHVTQACDGLRRPVTIVESTRRPHTNPAQPAWYHRAGQGGRAPRGAPQRCDRDGAGTPGPPGDALTWTRRAERRKARTQAEAEAVLKDIVKLGETYDVEAAADFALKAAMTRF